MVLTQPKHKMSKYLYKQMCAFDSLASYFLAQKFDIKDKAPKHVKSFISQ